MKYIYVKYYFESIYLCLIKKNTHKHQMPKIKHTTYMYLCTASTYLYMTN